MGLEVCNTFNEIDKLFIDYEVNEKEFNASSGLYNKYCPVKNGSNRCDTDYEKLSAISGYAYVELTKNEQMNLDSAYDPSLEFLVMGWCHRLYKISKDHKLSLKDSFEKYLNNYRGNFNYRSILYNKKHLMDSNIAIMNLFYLLFQQICETINTYETYNVQHHQYISGFTQSHIMYSKLYKLVNQCGPYIQLLNHLKTIYDELKKAVIKYNDYDPSLNSQLIELLSIDKTKFGSGFNSAGCNRVHQMLEKKISKLKNEGQEEQDELNTLMELLVYDEDDDGDDADSGDDAVDNVDDGEKEGDTMESIDNTPQNHETDLGNSLDQSNISNGAPNQSQCDTTDNTDDLNDKEQPKHKPEQTLDNSQSSYKSPENPSDEQLPKETAQENHDTAKESKDDTQEPSLTKKESTVETIQSMKSVVNLFKPHLLSFNKTLTNIGNNAYEKTLQTLKNTSSKLTELVSEINNAINQPNKETVTHPSGNNGLEPGDSGSDPPSSDDPSVDPPPMLPNSQPEPTKQSETEDKQGEGLKEKDQQSPSTIQEPSDGSINTKPYQVTKQDISGNNINGIISENVSSMDILKKHKLIVFSVIAIAIPITLAIMYKYLGLGWRKKLKRKKNMKKVVNLISGKKTEKSTINSIRGKKQMQIIINSSSRKKQTKKPINSVCRGKPPLLNIYKLTEADPLPFINLFFLLIFFVYKRKDILLNAKYN
ncbi:CIR protein [Plasmodium chabaudi adami]|uniref:CIR protein n=1 Tax=Plasmodium chabaudi adami TaxID=5826 RepID=A0A1C6WTC1_PLACE|nr:CIR protein [Plasmodium chabaudi adami]